MKYFLISPEKEVSAIYIDINYQKKRYRLSTEIVIESNSWNNAEQVVNKSAKDYKRINSLLKSFRKEIEELLTELKIQTVFLTNEEFVQKINSIIKPKETENTISDKKSVLDYFTEYISNRKQLANTSKKTIVIFESVYKLLREFEKFRAKEIEYDEINLSFYEELQSFFINQKKHQNANINFSIKIFGMFLKYSLENRYCNNDKILKKKNLKANKNEDLIALTEQEVNKIKAYQAVSKLAIIKDLFLLQIQTMLRVSDLRNIKLENVNFDKKELNIWQIKTSSYLRIPLTNASIEIIKKYNGIPKISIEYYNILLKKLCKLVGITESVEIVKFIGNQRITEIKPKYQLISSHTARRTGITILLMKGLAPELIMKVSGHLTTKSFQKYVKINQNTAVESVKNIWNNQSINH